ncbi:MAG: DAK2 domain-containing protein [Actinomycetota bacterium]|nr:DAK2 domain-containing protein [Actinomycetota bacterium]
MTGLNGDREAVEKLVDAALASLEANRARIDDLNVYPVPDGDTGTNLTMTVRAVADAVDHTSAASRHSLARDVARGALMGARGNSGVIFSQIVRGAADVLGETEEPVIDADATARALRGASDAAYRAVRRPVEGTMLSVIRELAEEAEARAPEHPPIGELLRDLVRRGEDALARTPEQLQVLKDAGVVDAGGAGLVELVRGVAAAVTGEPIPEPPPIEEHLSHEAIHQEPSQFRYCTVFLIEGEDLDRETLEDELEKLGDSLLVVGDPSAIKVHVHTDDPGAALSVGTKVGTIDRIEIANMHEQTQQREERLLSLVPDAEPAKSGVVAVVAGEGNRKLFESLAAHLGPISIVEGGQTMNPSTADLLRAAQSIDAEEALILPNNSNIVLAAEHAAANADRTVEVVPTTSIPAGLAAMVAFDGSRTSAENAKEMREAIESVATGEVTIASRDVQMNGIPITKGEWLGLSEGEPVSGGADFDDVTYAVVERLLSEPRELLTLLVGRDGAKLQGVLDRIAEEHPEVEVDVQEGGQPHYHLLLSAE